MQEEMAFTAEEGSRQLVYGAVGSLDDEEKLRGKYIQMSEVVEGERLCDQRGWEDRPG